MGVAWLPRRRGVVAALAGKIRSMNSKQHIAGSPVDEFGSAGGAPTAGAPFSDPLLYGEQPSFVDSGFPVDPSPYAPQEPLDAEEPRKPRHRALKIVLGVAGALILVVAVIVATNVYTVISTRDDVHRVSTYYNRGADAIVVLGASVFADGTPSDILADRLEIAADLYNAGAAREIIVSGDNTDAHYNESDAMRDYLVTLGVPEDAIVVDHLGTDTYASIYRAKNAYGANNIVVVTQAYHLYRALMIADGLGMEAGGVAADKGAYEGQTEYSVREMLARTKDWLLTLVQAPVSTATARAD